MITTEKVLNEYSEYIQPIYFSIVKRDGVGQIYKYGAEDREYTSDDIIDLLKEKGTLIVRKSAWTSTRAKHKLSYENDLLFVDGQKCSPKGFANFIESLTDQYVVVGDYDDFYMENGVEKIVNQIRFYVTNDLGDDDKILDAIIYIYANRGRVKRYSIDLDEGSFVSNIYDDDCKYIIPGWDKIVDGINKVTAALDPLSYFAIDVVVNDDGFKIINFSYSPNLPAIQFGDKLNDFLKARFEKKRQQHKPSLKVYCNQMKKSLGYRVIRKLGRPGIRSYMQKLWLESAFNDFKGTKLPLHTKIWAWKRGFLSYHTYQYGLTEDNYKNYLADYDYYWLNRINNGYQNWINDKTTFRYTMDSFKDSIPAYYYSIYKDIDGVKIKTMQDCPCPELDPLEGIFKVLEDEKKLALKASAGTHGDGFYSMAFSDGKYLINGEEMTKDEIIDLINSLKSFYIVTQWINLHHELKEIYPNSVSSIRVMVINRHGYDPKIMQTYIRIGSSKTGFTDNVGYGGICAMIDTDTGVIYNPETIVDHVFYPCPTHPDTGTEIGGRQIPCWEEAKKLVLDISRSMPELEYLGYDVAITETGPQIIEINIHQDLHKCNLFSEEIMDFFNDKIEQKKARYNLN